MADRYDIAIVGGGIVGLATARALTDQAPSARLVILEKEDHVGAHQTGHNSGVIHSGIYYKPGSYKARLTVEGKNLMYAFCEQHDIKVERCGKIIVATSQEELPRLQMIYERGQANGVPCELLDRDRLRELEPHANALQAVHSPSTGIIDYKDVMAAMVGELTDLRTYEPWTADQVRVPLLAGFGTLGAPHHKQGMQHMATIVDGATLVGLYDTLPGEVPSFYEMASPSSKPATSGTSAWARKSR
jgi:hypothetical protein